MYVTLSGEKPIHKKRVYNGTAAHASQPKIANRVSKRIDISADMPLVAIGVTNTPTNSGHGSEKVFEEYSGVDWQ